MPCLPETKYVLENNATEHYRAAISVQMTTQRSFHRKLRNIYGGGPAAKL
jgi:hypothetical protein